MKRLFAGMVAGAALLVSAAMGEEGAALKKPKEFPAVPVTRGVPIQYATVPMDTWTGRVAYLLVEGSSTSGYTRVFAWIPKDTRFGKPVEWKPKTAEALPNTWVFGELENKDAEGDDKININWRFTSHKEGRGAGTDTTVDYVTGKTTVRKWGASTWHRLYYTLNLGYAYGKGPAASMDGGYPLEVARTDDLRLYEKWEQVPEPSGAAFSAVIRAKHVIQESRDPKKARLLCQFDSFYGSSIKKAPADMAVGLLVTPYMGEPVYSNTVALAEFMKTGFDLEVPYGWYTLRLRGFRYGRFSFAGDFYKINFDPIPISRPSGDGN